MMRKIILIASAAFVAIVVLSVNVSLNRNSHTGNIDLAQLTLTNEADAECVSTSINNGRCGISGICFWGRETGTPCDTTAG